MIGHRAADRQRTPLHVIEQVLKSGEPGDRQIRFHRAEIGGHDCGRNAESMAVSRCSRSITGCVLVRD